MATYQIETDGGTYQVETDDAPETSALGAASRGALDAVPFGTKAAAAIQPGDYQHNLGEMDSMLAADKAQHPVAHYGGEAAGTVAPFLIPGVGEALGAESLAGRAGIGAGLGALQAASNNRDSNTMTGDIAKGAVSGGVLGPVAGAAGDAIGSMIGKTAPGLEASANRSAFKAGDIAAGKTPYADSEIQELGSTLRGSGVVKPFNSSEQMYKAASDLQEKAGQKIGEIGDIAGQGGLSVDEPGMMTQPLLEKADELSKLAAPDAQRLAKSYAAAAEDINNLGDTPTWKQLQDLKQRYGGLAFDGMGQVKNQGYADAYFAMRDGLKSIADKAGGDASIGEEYRQALKQYSALDPVVTGLGKTVARNQVQGPAATMRPMKIIRNLPGPARAIAGTVAASTGHPLLALGAALPELTNPAIHAAVKGGMASAAAAAPEAAGKAAPSVLNGLLNHPAMQPFQQHFQNALQGVTDRAEQEKAAAVTDYTLSQSNPAYAKAKAAAQGELK